MTDIDALTNEQLRLRLLEYGFANMPVTSTTRNVLIKKLKKHLEGEKSKTRRETIHVAKYSSGEEDNVPTPKKNNRRATMAAPEVIKAATPVKPVRRSVDRSTPKRVETTPEKRGRGRPTKTKSNDFDSVEETDEELKELVETRSKRNSKSPSLTKTKVITTSYKNKSVVVEDDEDEEVTEPEIDERPTRRASPPARPALDRADLRRRTTLAAGPIRQTNYEPEVREYANQPKISRPSLSTSYNTSYTSPPSYNNRRYTSYTQQKEELYEEDEPADVSTPYLSDFTRRLQQLKAEPLTTPMKPAIPRGTGVYYRTGKNSQVPLNKPDSSDTLGASIKDVFRSLASYKKTFFFLFIILAAIFLFVMYYL